MDTHWDEIVDVVVVGDGCAGQVTAIAAKEEGANVLVLEKQPKDSHCTSSAMSGGGIHLPDKDAMKYLDALWKIPVGTSWVETDIIQTYINYGMKVKGWLEKHGGQFKVVPARRSSEHTEIPGNDAFTHLSFAGRGYGLQRFLDAKLIEKGIPVKYNSPAKRLITDSKGQVLGVEAEQTDGSSKQIVRIGASKGVVLAPGGFEFNEVMKLNYLPVHPSYFTGHPSATGDGIRMAMAVGADLWHMNCVSARLVAKYPEFPIAFSLSPDSMRVRGVPGAAKTDPSKRPGYLFVDRKGKRFTNEDFKFHAVYYEVTSFDTHRMVYPRVPCYWIMDRRRIEIDALVTLRSGAAGPCRLYEWKKNNSKELEKGWIITGKSIKELAGKLDVPADNLEETVNTYNRYCTQGKDPDFNRPEESLIPLETSPFFALRMWPGGPNTQGGPKRNARCQVLNVDGEPIPGLYSAGEIGSLFGMLYPGGGSNLAECMAMGLVAGENVAHENRK
jgi:succinate dehydrogenase/fumarate reductase flavoprotein subunit